MSHLKNGLSLQSGLSVSVFHHTVVALLLTHTCAGQSQVIGPPQPIVAMVGGDIILPSHLEPAVDAFRITVEWARPDLEPRFVHVWRDGVDLLVHQNPSYRGRTSLSLDKLKNGDVSLRLSEVKLSDEGKYRCFIPSLGKDSFVKLVVGAASSPVLNVSKSSSGVVLECESKGWYPEPELFWLDAEGKLLSAGAPETVRGPDGLYTVSSRVTVEKSHSNSFTCRVQQSKTQQTRETQIHVPDYFFVDICDSIALYVSIVFAVISVFMCIVAVVFVCKWRQNKIKSKKHEGETDQREEEAKSKSNTERQDLIETGRDREQLEAEGEEKRELSMKIAKLEEELQKSENEQKHQREECEKLKEEQREVTEQLRQQPKEAKRQRDENERRLRETVKQTEGVGTNEINKFVRKIKEELKKQQWTKHTSSRWVQPSDYNALIEILKQIQTLVSGFERKMTPENPTQPTDVVRTFSDEPQQHLTSSLQGDYGKQQHSPTYQLHLRSYRSGSGDGDTGRLQGSELGDRNNRTVDGPHSPLYSYSLQTDPTASQQSNVHKVTSPAGAAAADLHTSQSYRRTGRVTKDLPGEERHRRVAVGQTERDTYTEPVSRAQQGHKESTKAPDQRQNTKKDLYKAEMQQIQEDNNNPPVGRTSQGHEESTGT